ncbi:hypothetical protein FVE89_11380 [Methylobacterium sp. 2A]|nr:hypothetical protein [Methylobacterium sp. 2A]
MLYLRRAFGLSPWRRSGGRRGRFGRGGSCAIAASMKAGRLVFPCGAGLSMAPPSSLPSA